MIRIINAALQVLKLANGEETLIIRGVLATESIKEIKSDVYQREIGSNAKLSDLADAIKHSSVPDIELGMRGSRVKEYSTDKVFHLQDDTYVIDGLQRISAAKLLMEREPLAKPQIGCVVHVCTTFEWERERFRILNQERTKLSPNILLRNMEGLSTTMDILLKLSRDKSFPLHDRVCWSQKMSRNHVITGIILLKSASHLHDRFGSGKINSINKLVPAQDRVVEAVGKITYRHNTLDFFNLVDECFGLKTIVYSERAPQIRTNFLIVLAEFLTRHDNFWAERRLVTDPGFRKKLSKFPLHDPSILPLCSSNYQGAVQLMYTLTEHINRGRRIGRLRLNAKYAEEVAEESVRVSDLQQED